MQPQYRTYQQTPQRQSHGSTRRGGIGPMLSQGPHHHQVPMTQAQLQAQQQAQQMANEQAKRRSRKPTDKNLPDGVEDVVIGDGAQRYKDLREFERRLDATITRKRLDIVDSINRNAKRYKTLRIWITNTVEDQPWQATADGVDFASNGAPSYRVKIEGRLLDDDEDKDEEEEATTSSTADKMDEDKPNQTNPALAPPKHRFSHFFREMNVEFDKKTPLSTETTVHWKKPDPPNAGGRGSAAAAAVVQNNPPAAADFDELTFKRSGDSNLNITIYLTRQEDPERYLLSPDLAEIVDMTEATRTEVTMGMWEYIKRMGLLEEDEKRNFRCDELLRKVVIREMGYLPLLNEYVTPHLKPLPPVALSYTIRVDEAFQGNPMPTIYDIRVAVDDSLRSKMLPLLMNPSYASMLKEVAALDEQLALLVQAIQSSKAKHAFLTSMAENPVPFAKNWMSSQQRDLEVIMGEAYRGGGELANTDEWRVGGESGPWASENARETVTMMLAKGLR